MPKKTNGQFFCDLKPSEQEDFRRKYGSHPLVDYIDWDAFYASDDGDEMNFVNCIRKGEDEEGNTVFVLCYIISQDEDYELIFVCGKNEFYKIPAEVPADISA